MSIATGVHALLERVARTVPDRVALVDATQRTLTFGDWHREAATVAAHLHAAGIRSGMRVGLVFDRADWIPLAIAYFAVQRLGAVTVTVSAGTPTTARRFICADAELSAWVVARADERPDGIEADGVPVHAVAGAQGRPQDLPEVHPAPGDPADILYTSGTTGLPKAVVTPHGLLEQVYADPPSADGEVGPPIVHCFPVGTSAALMMLFAPFQGIPHGGRPLLTRAVCTLAHFTVEELCRVVALHGVTLVFLVPATLAHLTRLTAGQREQLRTVDVLHCGSAPLDPANASTVARLLPGASIVNAYGSTEMWPAMLAMPFSDVSGDVVGRAGPDTAVRIRDLGTGELVGPAATGSVEVRSLRTDLRRWYLRDEVPSATYRPDGWVVTGDVGYLDADGYLHLSGRTSDLLNVGGEKIASRPIEVALLAHPEVASAAVVGLPHPKLGEYCAAFVVLRHQDVALRDLRAHLLRHLPPKLVPRRVFALEHIPQTPNGKVVKHELVRAATHTDGALVELR